MLEAILLVLSLCIDACAASFAYGTNKIKIPIGSNLMLTAISTIFLAISLSVGSFLQQFINPDLTHLLCFATLFILGFMRFFEGVLKNYLNKKSISPDNIEVKLFNFKLVLNVYADVTLADIDHSKSLSLKEALYLGIALSLDSLVIGLGAALIPMPFIMVVILSIIIHFVAILLGSMLGKQCAKKSTLDLSWLSGVILIILALTKIL